MRAIKFRGFCTLQNKWVYGALHWNPELMEDKKPIIHDYTPDGIFVVEPESVGQFIGICDKTGRELYEGDVVTIAEGMPAILIWKNENTFEVKYKKVGYYFCDVTGTRPDKPLTSIPPTVLKYHLLYQYKKFDKMK